MIQKILTSNVETKRRLSKASVFTWAPIIVLALIPIPLWILGSTVLAKFNSLTNALASLGQLAALVGVVLFSINLWLSARPRFLEKHFQGLNHLYKRHMLIGKISLVLLISHPLLLIPLYTGNDWSKVPAFLLPGSSWVQDFGIYALSSMFILIIITLHLRPKYNIWKWTHKFLGGSFFLASFHIWFIPSDVSYNLPLRVYILTIAAIGLAVFIYKSILGRWLIPRVNYIVSNVTKLTEQIYEIALDPVNKSLRFFSGQFVFISFFDPKVSSESHPFTISSSPAENTLRFTIKNLGDFTETLPQLSKGSIAKLEGPFGTFNYEKGLHKRQIWIAGGIGITPFLSMAQTLPAHPDYQIELYYSTRTASEAVRLEELRLLEKEIPDIFRVHTHVADSANRITVDHIENTSQGLENKDFFICAPPAMIGSLRDQLKARGVFDRSIHSEEFSF